MAKSFKKIRVNRQKPNKELNALFERKESLKLLLNDEQDEETVEAIEAELENVSDEIAEKNKDIANEMLGRNSDPVEGFSAAKTWSLKKRLAPKNTMDPPMAKKDPHGNLVTDKSQLEELYLNTYLDRLQPNSITPGLEVLEEIKEYLYELRLELCQTRKSKDWTIDDLENVLKQLKTTKLEMPTGIPMNYSSMVENLSNSHC